MPRASLSGTLPSPSPILRRGLLVRYVSTGSTTSIEHSDTKFNKKLSAQATHHLDFILLKASPRVPTELLDHIISLFTVSFCLPVPTRRTAFALIKPLILVSKSFRLLVLRHYFAILVLENKSSIGLFRFLENEDATQRWHGWTGGFVWVRSVQVWLPVSSIQCLHNKKMAHILGRYMPLLMYSYRRPVWLSLPWCFWKSFGLIFGEKDWWPSVQF